MGSLHDVLTKLRFQSPNTIKSTVSVVDRQELSTSNACYQLTLRAWKAKMEKMASISSYNPSQHKMYVFKMFMIFETDITFIQES